MSNVHYEADARRLRLEGEFRDTDLPAVQDAVDTFGDLADGDLTVDLTAVTGLAPEVAGYLVEAKADAAAHGRSISLLRKLDTPTDHALNESAATDTEPGDAGPV